MGYSTMNRWKLLPLFLFVLLGIAIYGNALDNPFQYDDTEYVVNNFNIRDIRNIPQFFIHPRMITYDPSNAGHYRPLAVMSYAINYAIGGLNPVSYHLVNLAFHTGSAFLIFLIVQAMLGGGEQVISPFVKGRWGDSLAALAAGLIFLVHPFNSEAVNYITARSSVMSGFFYLVGFWCWVKFRSKKQEARSKIEEDRQGFSNFLPLASYFYIASLLAFVAGMLSKEVVVTLLIVLWLYDVYFKGVWRRMLDWRTYIPYIPFVLIVVIPYLIIRIFSFGNILTYFRRDLHTQIFTELPVLVRYWLMFLLPKGLSLIHNIETHHNLSWRVLLSAILLFTYIFVAIYMVRLIQNHWRMFSFFMVWFFIVLLPTTIIPLNDIFQENRGYLAMVSFAAMGGVVLEELNRRKSRRLAIVGVAVLIVAYSGATMYRNTVWGDEVTFWKDAIEKAPRSASVYTGLADAYRKQGDLFLSIEAAKKGVSIDPNDYYLRVNLGTAYHLVGNIEKAVQEYEEALKIDPGRALIWNELALLYIKQNDPGRGEKYLKKAVSLWKAHPLLHHNLGMILAEEGRLLEAVEEFQMVINISPAYLQAHYELGNTLEKLGRREEALEQYSEIIRLGSDISLSESSILGQDRMMVERMVERAQQRLSRNGWATVP